MPRPSHRTAWPLVAALLAPVLLCYTVLFRYAIALPLLDDYDATLGFLLRLQQIHGLWPRLLATLADQQAEYKFLLEHLLLAAQFGLIGHLSLGPLILLGNLLLLPILFVFARDLFPGTAGRERLLLLLPAAFLATQLTFAEVFNWAVASLNALAVVAFVLLALHLVDRRSCAALTAACLAAAVACTASTNAFLAAPLGFLLLLRRRRWAALLPWTATFVAMLFVYFFRYQRVVHPLSPPLATRALFFFSFLGGTVEDMHRRPVPGAAILLGLLLLAVVVHAAATGYAHRNPVMLSIALWTLLTAAAVANFRSTMGVSQSLSGRYKLYCMLLLVFAYGYLADRVRNAASLPPAAKRNLWRSALALSLALYLAGTVEGADFLRRRHDNLVAGMRHFLADPAHNTPLLNPTSPEANDPALQEHLRDVLTKAITRGVYSLPPLPSLPNPRERRGPGSPSARHA